MMSGFAEGWTEGRRNAEIRNLANAIEKLAEAIMALCADKSLNEDKVEDK